MFRIVIWGTGYGYNQYLNLMKYQELLGEIEIVGVTGKDVFYFSLDGYQFIPIDKLTDIKPDYIVVTTESGFREIVKTGMAMGMAKERFLLAKVFAIPNFLFSKYVLLHESKVSIIANNCWGGLVYHNLGLEFNSPFINMFENDEDYLKIVNDLKYYLNAELQLERYGTSLQGVNYPICKLRDVELHFNHYSNMNEVEKKWYKRIERINWDNLFIMMYTSEESVASTFDKLKYIKKICFVPFPTSLKTVYYMRMVEHEELKMVPFWEIVNKTASGLYQDMDLIELLSTGEIMKRCQNISSRSNICHENISNVSTTIS